MRGRIGQPIDDLQLLDDRARPAMRDDHRQRIVLPGPNVDEVDVDPVDLGDELRQRVQPRLHLPPVVIGLPVADQRLHRREPHALRLISNDLLVRPPACGEATAQINQVLLRHIDTERTNCIACSRQRRLNREQAREPRCGDAHGGAAQKLASVGVEKVGARLRFHRESPWLLVRHADRDRPRWIGFREQHVGATIAGLPVMDC